MIVSAVLAHDAVLVAGSAIERVLRKHGTNLFANIFSHHQLYNDGYPGLYCRPIEDRQHLNRPFEPFGFGDKILDALKQVKPFVMLKRRLPGEPSHQGNDRFEGYCVDLLKLLANNITGFEYEIFISEGNKYGARQEDGSWDGMIGYLLNETADVAVAPLTINEERERVVDFSKPFMTTGISIMIKKPEKQEFSVFSFMQPLSMRIWMFILCSYVGVRFLLRQYFKSIQRLVSFFAVSLFATDTCSTLSALSGRIASSAWWFFTLIIVSSYTANLAAFLTLEKMTPPIESVDDLAAQQKILYGIGRYAFLLEETANEYENTRKPCDTMKFEFTFSLSFRGSLNLAILYLQEKGELKRLENKWWYDRGQCDQGMSVSLHY
uniref:Uncharacterized protein n=1 Tax=Parascaris equorum TaxID=6256 RepID=A0A914RST2_PAREQ